MNFGLEDTKTPVNMNQYWSDGDTIPYIVKATDGLTAAQGELTPGMLVERGPDKHVGIVTQLGDPTCTPDMSTNPATEKAVTNDRIELRITGLVKGKLPATSTGAADGARMGFTPGDQEFAPLATGVHQLIGSTQDNDTHALIKINVYDDTAP